MDAASKRALIGALAGVVLVTLYAFSFVFAQATPEPHELPVAVAGPPARVAELARRIETAAGDSYDVHRLAGADAARAQLRRGRIYVAVVVGDGPARLLAATALGRDATMAAETELPRLLGLPGTTLPQVEEIRPLVEDDPEGAALNLSLFPLIIVGIVVPILLLLVASSITVRARMAVVALFALLGGAGSTLMVNAVLHGLPGSYLALTGVAIMLAFAIGACTTAAVAVLGPPGVALGLLTFLIVGNVASGAQVQHEQLPAFYRVLGPYLPPGAAADALRSIAYFDATALLRPLLVLAAFGVAGTAVALALGDRRPAPQGSPAGPTADAR